MMCHYPAHLRETIEARINQVTQLTCFYSVIVNEKVYYQLYLIVWCATVYNVCC